MGGLEAHGRPPISPRGRRQISGAPAPAGRPRGGAPGARTDCARSKSPACALDLCHPMRPVISRGHCLAFRRLPMGRWPFFAPIDRAARECRWKNCKSSRLIGTRADAPGPGRRAARARRRRPPPERPNAQLLLLIRFIHRPGPFIDLRARRQVSANRLAPARRPTRLAGRRAGIGRGARPQRLGGAQQVAYRWRPARTNCALRGPDPIGAPRGPQSARRRRWPRPPTGGRMIYLRYQ